MSNFYFPRTLFVKSSFTCENGNTTTNLRADHQKEKGKEISQFYKNEIMKEDENDDKEITLIIQNRRRTRNKAPKCEKGKPSEKGTPKRKGKRKVESDLFRLAEWGSTSSSDQREMKSLIHHFGVDCKDIYGWTPLMKAVKASNYPMSKLLLENGANTRTKAGIHSVTSLMTHHHPALKDLIHDHHVDKKAEIEIVTLDDEETPPPEFYCQKCDIKYSNERIHGCSIGHNMRIHSDNKPTTFYGIPDHNKGFQMMLRKGWDRDKGLGQPRKEGRLYPVQSVIKKDRRCLGSKDAHRYRVTHFGPYDSRAVQDKRKSSNHSKTKTVLDRQIKESGKKDQFLRNELADL